MEGIEIFDTCGEMMVIYAAGNISTYARSPPVPVERPRDVWTNSREIRTSVPQVFNGAIFTKELEAEGKFWMDFGGVDRAPDLVTGPGCHPAPYLLNPNTHDDEYGYPGPRSQYMVDVVNGLGALRTRWTRIFFLALDKETEPEHERFAAEAVDALPRTQFKIYRPADYRDYSKYKLALEALADQIASTRYLVWSVSNLVFERERIGFSAPRP